MTDLFLVESMFSFMIFSASNTFSLFLLQLVPSQHCAHQDGVRSETRVTSTSPMQRIKHLREQRVQRKEHITSTSSLQLKTTFLKILVPSTIIGVTFGYKRDSIGNFIWDRTKDRGSYANWNTGEPNNANSGEGCGFMYISESQRAGKWNDVPCSDEFTFVCKRGE